MTHILIISARFYPDIADALEAGAKEALDKAGARWDIEPVPGAFEIPATIRMALDSGTYDGYIALGCVIRGETSHYDYVCGESAHGLNQLALEHKAPIGYGILTVENKAQALARADGDKGRKGVDAADACLRMIELKKKWKS